MKSLRSLLVVVIAVAGLWFVSMRPWALGAERPAPPWRSPEFTHADPADWINSRPLKLADLRGKVVLVEFWTFGCWNCNRSVPWVKDVEARFGDEGLVVIGVHTPEFKYEKDRAAVVKAVAKLELEHPVMVDNDFSYWKAMNNRYWPTFYLLDKSGRVRHHLIGEVHTGDDDAGWLEGRIQSLLSETI